MRIGMVTGEYPPMEGGVGAFTREIARAMAALGHDLHICTRAEAAASSENSITVSGAVGAKWGWATNGLIRKWARANRLDVVDVQYQTAAFDMHPAIHWLPSRLREPACVVTFHDLRVPYLFPKAGPLRAWIVRRLAHSADGAIATDRADERTLRDDWRLGRVRWVPIGSNVAASPPQSYDRASWRARLGAAPGDLLIAYFGFLNESKGGLVLVEALAQLAARGVPARLVMIGGRAGASDPTNRAYGERIDALIAATGLGERVHWTGFVADEQVSAHFLASDVTALPYLDGVSLRRGTLMAALAHGRAIVTTQPQTSAPELENVVETIPRGDAGALADCIEALWRSPSRRQALESAAARAAGRFSWAGIAQETLAFYGDILRQLGQPAARRQQRNDD
jgi:glycosyltransferase involved in cell wall biosynthesis